MNIKLEQKANCLLGPIKIVTLTKFTIKKMDEY